jgi:hypothetical protein
MPFDPVQPRKIRRRTLKSLPVKVEILRDEELEIRELGFDQFLGNILDCDI